MRTAVAIFWLNILTSCQHYAQYHSRETSKGFNHVEHVKDHWVHTDTEMWDPSVLVANAHNVDVLFFMFVMHTVRRFKVVKSTAPRLSPINPQIQTEHCNIASVCSPALWHYRSISRLRCYTHPLFVQRNTSPFSTKSPKYTRVRS